MSNSLNRPILFFAFANDYRQDGVFLAELAKEREEIEAAMAVAEKEELCELLVVRNASIKDVFNAFQKHKNRIVFFHYGGHAEAEGLLLNTNSEKPALADRHGLAKFLGRQAGLVGVYFNACSTAYFTRTLLDEGIPFVIGTTKSISDRVACQLATRFYKGIAKGWPLKRAWEDAKSEAVTQGGEEWRGLFGKNKMQTQYPWEQLTREGAEAINHWNLPAQVNNYLFGLPALGPAYQLPELPYRFLATYQKEDAAVFFGRNRIIRTLYHQITDAHSAPVILLTGSSGVGKSSFLEAGLLPRLEGAYTIRVQRLDTHQSLIKGMSTALGMATTASVTAQQFLEEWLALEEQRPLLLIIDQLEAIFRQKGEKGIEDLRQFLGLISLIFSNHSLKPQGKLILSYRKEYDSELEAAFREAQIPREKVFLEPLNQQEIEEIVLGLASTNRLRKTYRMEVEEGLPLVIANDLLSSSESPVAPGLQIILTKLWKRQIQEEKEQRVLSFADYNQIRKNKAFLNDFFQQQLEQLAHWAIAAQNDTVSSGLALALLHFLTTEQQQSRVQTWSAIQQKYPHRKAILPSLMAQLVSLKLIRRTDQPQQAYHLMHDTLAPLVQEEMAASNCIGQQAARILSVKMKLLEEASATPIMLDEAELRIVEDGHGGMREWTFEERQLVEKSRKENDKRLSRRKLMRRARVFISSLLFILAMLIGLLAWREHRSAQVNKLISQSLQEVNQDATQALTTINEALKMAPQNTAALQTYHDIYSHNEFYRKSLLHPSPVRKALFVESDNRILSASAQQINIFNWEGTKIDSIPHTAELLDFSVSKNGQMILTGGKDHTARLWTKDGRLVQSFQHESEITRVECLPNSRRILLADQEGGLRIWEPDAQHFEVLEGHTDEVSAIAFSSGGDTIVSGGLDGNVFIWSSSGEQLGTIVQPTQVLAVAIAPDGKHLLTGSRDGVARLWRFNQYDQPEVELRGHEKRINDLMFTPNGAQIFTVSDDHTLRSWDTTGVLLQVYKGHSFFIHDLDITADGRHLLTASEDRTLKHWTIDSKVSQALGPHPAPVYATKIISDGPYIFSGTGGETKDALDQMDDLQNEVDDLENEADDFFDLFEDDATHDAYLWDRNGQLLQTFSGHQKGITALDFSVDQQWLLTASEDATAGLWNLDGDRLLVLEHQMWVNDVVFVPDNKTILTASMDSTVRVWNTSGEVLKQIEHPAGVSAVTYHPTDSFFLTGCLDGKLRQYQFDGTFMKVLLENEATIQTIAYSADGNYIAVGFGGLHSSLSLYQVDGTLLWTKAYSESSRTGGIGVQTVEFLKTKRLISVLVEGLGRQVLDLEGRAIISLSSSQEVFFDQDSILVYQFY